MFATTRHNTPSHELEAKANIGRYLWDWYPVRYAVCTQQSAANDLVSCVVAGAVRLYFGYELSAFKASVVMNSYYSCKFLTPTYFYPVLKFLVLDVSVNLIVWSEIEPCVSIIAACLPTFGPLVKNGHSIQSLARSLQSKILKQKSSDSTSIELAASAWPVENNSRQPRGLNRRPQGTWDTPGDDDTNTLVNKDLELGNQRTDDIDNPYPPRISKISTATSE